MDSSYRLESLEPRLLLSGTGLPESLLAANAPVSDPLVTSTTIDTGEEISIAEGDLHSYQPEKQLTDLFQSYPDQVEAGLVENDPLEPVPRADSSEDPAIEPPLEQPIVATDQFESPSSGMEWAVQSEQDDSTVGSSPGAADQLSSADMLVETLDAAQPPPSVQLNPETPLVIADSLKVENLSGTGTVFGDVVVTGLCSPGNSPGKLDIVGDYTLLNGDIEPGGFFEGGTTLHMEIGGKTPGSEYDQLNVTGTLTIGGTLQIELIGDYTPQVGDTFTILTYGQLQGEFDAIEGLSIGQGLYFDVQEQAGQLDLVVNHIYSSTDLVSYIGGILGQITNEGLPGDVEVTPGDVQLGGWLAIDSPTLVFDIDYDSNTDIWSGSVGIECGSASIFIGDSFTAGIVDGDNDGIALEGAYTLTDAVNLDGQLTLTADQFDLVIPDLLTATATGISLSYDPNGSATQTIFELDALSVQVIPLDGIGVEINDLVVRADGFSLANATVAADHVGWLDIGPVLRVSGLSLTFADFSYSSDPQPIFTGQITVAVDSVELFPDANVDATAGAIAITVDLSTGHEGELLIQVGQFELTLDGFVGSAESVIIDSGGGLLSGTIGVALNVGEVSATVNGSFEFQMAADSVVAAVSAASFSWVLGTGSEGVRVNSSQMSGALLLTELGAAGKLAVGELSVSDADGDPLGYLQLEARDFDLEFNTTRRPVEATIGAVTLDYTHADQYAFLSLNGSADLTVSIGTVAATVDGSFAFEKTAESINLGVSEASAKLAIATISGNLEVGFGGMSGSLLLDGTAAAGELDIATISLEANGSTLGGLSFSVTDFSLAFNTGGLEPFLSFSGSLELALAMNGFSTEISGSFSFAKSPDTIDVSVSDASADLTIGAAPGGVRVAFTGMSGALLLNPLGAAGKLQIATVVVTRADGITQLPGIAFAVTDFYLGFNTTGETVPELSYTVSQQTEFIAFQGELDLTVSVPGFSASVSGLYAFEKSADRIDISVSGANTSFAAGSETTKVRLDFLGMTGALALTENGAAGKLAVETISLTRLIYQSVPEGEEQPPPDEQPLTGLTFQVSDFHLEFNTTGGAITAPGFDFSDPAQAKFLALSGILGMTVSLNSVSVEVSGGFAFQIYPDQVLVVVNQAGTSLATAAVEVSFTGINGAMLLLPSGTAGRLAIGAIDLTRAIDSSAIDNPAFSVVDFSIEFNTTDELVTLTLDEQTVFDYATEDRRLFLAMGGTLDLSITVGSLTSALRGGFGFQAAASEIEATVSGGSASLAVGDVAVSVTGIEGTFQMVETGAAGLLTVQAMTVTGLEELGISGAISDAKLAFNTTGGPILDFTDTSQYQFFQIEAGMSLRVGIGAAAVEVQGRFGFEKSTQTVNGFSTEVIKVSISSTSGASAFLAAGGMTFSATGITGAFLAYQAGMAGKLYVEEIAISGLELFDVGQIALEFNTTGAALQTSIGGVELDYATEEKYDFLTFSFLGKLNIDLGGIAYEAQGEFGLGRVVQPINSIDTTLFMVWVNDLWLSLGVGPANEIAVTATGIDGALLALDSGIAGKLTVGEVAFSGLGGELEFAAAISDALLEFNTTGQELRTQVGNVALEFGGPERLNFLEVSLSTDLTLSIGSVSAVVSGRFAFEKSSQLVNEVQTEIITVVLIDGRTSLTIGTGGNGVQVAFTDLNGALLVQSSDLGTVAAGKLTVGAIAVTRADGETPLDLFRFTTTNVVLAFNTTNATLVTEIAGIPINFLEDQEYFFSIGGTLDLGIADFITLKGSFGFQKTTTEIHVVAEGVDAALRVGSFQAGIRGGTLALLINANGTIALDASGALVLEGAGFAAATAAEVRIQYNNTGVDFSGHDPLTTLTVAGVSATLQMGMGTEAAPLARVNVTGLLAELAGLVSVEGNFSFEAGTTAAGIPAVKVAASMVEIYLGDGNTDYVSIIDGHGGMVVTEAGLACRVEATVTLDNVPGVILEGTLGLAINTGADPVKESFLVGTEVYQIDLPGGPFVRAEGDPVSLSLTAVTPVTTLSGRIAFQQSTDSEGNKVVIIVASRIGIVGFTGTGADPGSPLDISGARGTLVIMSVTDGGVTDTGVAGSLAFESQVAIGGVEAGAEFKLVMSDIPQPVDIEGPFGSIHFDAGPFILIEISDLTISFPGVEIEGDFSFRQATREDGSTFEVIIGNNVRVFVGDTDSLIGLELSEGQAVFLRSGDADAGFISGRVQLLGVEGLVLSARLTLRINESAQPVTETTFFIDEEMVTIAFAEGEHAEVQGEDSFIQFGGEEIQLSVLNTLELRGNLTFTRQGDSFMIGAAGVQAFIGDGPAWDAEGNILDDATGVLVKNITLGMVILPGGKFAFAGEGELTFLGLSGLTVTGLSAEATLGVRLNRSGEPLDLSIPVLGYGEVPLKFDDASDAPEFKGGLVIGYTGVFELEGTVSFRQLPAGGADVTVESASLKIYSGAEVAFSIGGTARFKIGGQAGFKLEDFTINEVSIFGTDLTVPSVPPAADAQPTADLVSPYSEGVLELASLNSRKYVDVMFNDPNGVGIDQTSISGDELKILFNGQDITANIGFLSPPIKLYDGIYRYSFSGAFPSAGQYTVEFVAGTWRDNASTPNYGLGETEHFVLLQTQTGQVPRAPPSAQLANPAAGTVIAPEVLNNRRYIDVVFTSRSGDPVDPSSVNGDEFTISGGAVLDAQLRPGAPLHVSGNTYRYFLIDAKPDNSDDLFKAGDLVVTFSADGIVAGQGSDAVGNLEKTETVTLDAGQSSGTATEGDFSLGPLALSGPSISIEDLGFAEGRIIVTISLGLDSGSLSFGGSGSGGSDNNAFSATLTGINATFDLGIGLPGDFSFSPTGRFSFSVSELKVEVRELLEVNAQGIFIQYDPAGGLDQEILRIDKAEVTVWIPFTTYQLTGTIRPYDPDPDDPGNPLMPGLVVRLNGFAIGEAELKLASSEKINLFGIVEIDDIRGGIAGFGVNFEPGNPIVFSGSIFFASGGAVFLPGKPFSASISDRDASDDLNPDGSPNDEALRADITFDDSGNFEALLFNVDTLTVELGGVLTLVAQDFDLDTGAKGVERIVSFGVIGARLTLGSLEIGGEARNFGFTASGAFVPGHPDFPDRNFAIVLSAGGADGSAVGWPEWLPVRIDTLGVQFPVVNDTLDFTDPIIVISASVTGIPGAPGLEFSGIIEDVKIRPALLLQGKFPIIDIGAIGVGVRGQMFGGSIDAALIGGILKLDANGDMMTGDGELAERILFMGLQGGFEFPGVGGLTIRLALSELGPLGVFVSASVPGGIVIEPNTGLAFNDFSAGVEFFKSLPSIDDPALLRQFGIPTDTTASDWLAEVKQQVVNQYNAIKDLGLPPAAGFLAAFTSPMVITGGAKVFTIYTSKEVFNGEVFLQFSTDGKFLIIGKLNFAADNISIAGRLYADLSNVIGGKVQVLFLADLPEQVRLLTVEGKLSLGFSNPDTGEEVEVPVANLDPANTDTTTTADLAFPVAGEAVDASLLNSSTCNNQYYIDLQFFPGANASLSYGTILDEGQEISAILTLVDGTKLSIGFDLEPLPVEVTIDDNYLPQYNILTDFDYVELHNRGVGRFRYLISDSEFQWQPGSVEITLIGGSWLRSDGAANEEALLSFTVAGPTAELANPAQGGGITFGDIQARMSVDVIFLPSQAAGAALYLSEAPIPSLSGDGLGSVVIVSAELLTDAVGPAGSITYRYGLEGTFSLGEVSLTFAAASFSDSANLANTVQIMSFTVVGTTADLSSPAKGAPIGLTELTLNPYIDVAFTPGGGGSIDEDSLSDGVPEIVVTLADGTVCSVTDDPYQPPELIGTNVYRYELTGDLAVGRVTVSFLPGSFADTFEVTNTAETEIFYIEQPTAALVNLPAGNTFQLLDINDVSSGLYPGEAETYFELIFNPTDGAEVDEATVQKEDLTIQMIYFEELYSIPATGVKRVSENGEPTNRFRFFFDKFVPPGTVTFIMEEGAWKDTRGNESAAVLETINVQFGLAVTLEIEGRVALYAADLLSEPIFEISGYVNLQGQAAVEGGGEGGLQGSAKLLMDFGGTCKLIYFGNIASAAGRFILDVQLPAIGAPPVSSEDALTVADLLGELGISIPEDHFAYNIELPRFWGVVKLETNFAALQNIGIDLEAAALLEVNVTKTVKTETLTLEGIPGDVLEQFLHVNRADLDELIGELDSATLHPDIEYLFSLNDIQLNNPEVHTVISGALWRIVDSGGQQYFVQLRNVSGFNPEDEEVLEFCLRTEIQTFDLQPMTLQVQAFGRAIFRLPPFANPEKTELGPEWFRHTGAFSMKLSLDSLEIFADGQLTFTPFGYEVLDIRAIGALLAERPIFQDGEMVYPGGIAGYFKLGGQMSLPGVLLSGTMEAYFNTFGQTKSVPVPALLKSEGVVDFDAVEIYGTMPVLNPGYDPTNAESPILVEDFGGTPGPYLVAVARADMELLELLVLQGGFRFAASPSAVEIQAGIATVVGNPFSGDKLFDLKGTAAFVLDADGLYGHATLDLDVDSTALIPGLDPGFQLTADFLLELNTASITKDIETFAVDTQVGEVTMTVISVSLPARTLRISAAGDLSFALSVGDLARLTGRFDFFLSEDGLSVSVNAYATVLDFAEVQASGALEIASWGLAGYVRLDAEATAPDWLEGIGFDFSAAGSASVFINTSDTEVVIDGISIAPDPDVRLETAGSLRFTIGGVLGFLIEGKISGTGSFDAVDGGEVTIDGLLRAEIGSVTLLQMGVKGKLIVEPVDVGGLTLYAVAGVLELTAQGPDSPLQGLGFSLEAIFLLEVNTTGLAHPDLNLEAGTYVRIWADGELLLAPADTGFKLDGDFFFEMSEQGLLIDTEADLVAMVAGSPILKLYASGQLRIDGSGLAGRIKLEAGSEAVLSSGTIWSFGGTFLLEVNLTDAEVIMIGDTQVNLPMGPYVRLEIEGHLDLLDFFQMAGDFTIIAGTDGLQIATDSTLRAKVGTTTLLSLDARGALLIAKDGIAAKIFLDSSAGISGTGFYFAGEFTFILNTTGRYIHSIAGQTVRLSKNEYVRIHVAGSLEVLNLISLNGTFDLTVDSTGLGIDIDAKLRIFKVSFDVDTQAAATSSGFALRTEIKLATATAFIPFPGIEIGGRLLLEINTTSGTWSGIPKKTARVTISDAMLNVLGFKLSGSLKIEVGSSGFKISIPNKPGQRLVLDWRPVLYAEFYGYLYSNGSFSFTATCELHASAVGGYLDATASITIGSSVFRFHVSGSAGVKITDDIRIGIGVEGNVEISGKKLSISVRGSIDTKIFGVIYGPWITFEIGTIAPPAAPQVDALEPILATRLSDGTLRLNMGSYAWAREAPEYTGIQTEVYEVRHVSGVSGSETVRVYAFGYSQIYGGVKRIRVYDAGSGNDTIRIQSGVLSDAHINAGNGNDTVYYAGSGTATIDGGSGDDVLTVVGGWGHTIHGGSGNDRLVGGAASETLDGGSGADTILAGGGNDALYGGSGEDRLYGQDGHDRLYGGPDSDSLNGDSGNDTLVGEGGSDTIDGGSGTDTVTWLLGQGADTVIGGSGSADQLQVVLGSGVDMAVVSSAPNGFQLTLPGAVLSVSGIEICDLDTAGGADAVTINALSATQLVTFNLALGSDSAQDTVSVIGSTGADDYSLRVTSEAVEIARVGGSTITVSQAGNSHGGSILAIILGDGNDSLDVHATMVGAATRVYAGSGNDTIQVGASGNVNGISEEILIDGQTGSDTLDVIDGDQDAPETVSLTPTVISGLDMGAEISYAGIEFLNLLLGARQDTVQVFGTHASTTTTIQAGGGDDLFNVGASAGGLVKDVAGRLLVDGQDGWDILNLDDSNAAVARDGSLTSAAIRGLGMTQGIDYYGLESLDMFLSGADLFIDGSVPVFTEIISAGFITVQRALAPAGRIVLDATEGIAAGEVETQELILGTPGDITDLTGTIQGQDISLNAGGSITLGQVISQELSATAGGTLSLDTTVGILEAAAGGNIRVVESESIVLRSLSSTAGSATVSAAGSITAQSVTAADDITLAAGGSVRAEKVSSAEDVTLTAGMEINAYQVTAGTDLVIDAGAGIGAGELQGQTVNLVSGGNITDLPGSIQGPDVHLSAAGSMVVGSVVAEQLVAQAGGAMILDTDVETLEATVGADLLVSESDAILLRWVGSTAGSVTVVAGGTITAQEVVAAEAVTLEAAAGIDDPGGILVEGSIQTQMDLILTAAADIFIGGSGSLAANAVSGTATLTAGGIVHSQSKIPVLSHTLRASAGAGIHLLTDVTVLFAEVSDAGDIWIQEIDGIVLSEVVAADGAIRLVAGNTIEARSVACLTDRPGASVALLALQGDILVDLIAVGFEFGQMSLCATNGDIREVDNFDADTDLFGHLGILYAAGQIGSEEYPELNLESELGQLIEVTGPNFDLHIKGDVELFFLISGRIRVTATGTIRVLYLESITGDIWLRACEEIEVDSASAGDDLWLWAGGSIHVSAETVWGAAGGISAMDDLTMWAKRDIAIAGAISAGDDVWAVAERGSIIVSSQISAGDDVAIKAGRGDVGVEGSIVAGGDVSIDVRRGDLTFSGAITAGDDVELEAGTLSYIGIITACGHVKLGSDVGDVIFEGTITAGKSVCIWSNLDPSVTGSIKAGCDIKIRSEADIVVDGSLIAGRDVSLSSCRSNVQVVGLIDAGDDVTIKAGRGDVGVEGSITAGDDVSIDVRRGDLTFSGEITAGDDVTIKACHGGITAAGSISAGDDVYIQSCWDLVFSGTITAEDCIKLRSIRGKVLLT
jgi:hypothetical protein